MTTDHFCPHHIAMFESNEANAFRVWNEVMMLGTQAYARDEFDNAIRYLGAALQIGLIRVGCRVNCYFDAFYVLEPLRYLVEHHLKNAQIETVYQQLDRVSVIVRSAPPSFRLPIRECLKQQKKKLKRIFH